MLVVGLCGKMGVGKDFIAHKYIVPHLARAGLDCLRLSFADQIKVNVMAKAGVSFADVFDHKTQATRTLLQREGTEEGRDVAGRDVWITFFDAWSRVFGSRGVRAIVACDVRFRNEADYIRARGGLLLKVVAPGRNERRLASESGGDGAALQRIRGHRSECDLDDLPDEAFDLVLCNDGASLDVQALLRCLSDRIRHELTDRVRPCTE